MSATPHRYCQCGKRLAHDRTGARCGACEREVIQQRAVPPELPADFWDTDQFRDAFAAQHMGRIARAYRKHPFNVTRFGKDGIPQEVLGDWLGLTQAQVSRVENGPPMRNLDTVAHWARALRIPEHLLWFRPPNWQTTVAIASRPSADVRSRPPLVAPEAGLFRLVPGGNDALTH